MTELQLQRQSEDDDKRERSHRRARVVKDLLVFQFKLLLEGFKDIVLGPLSIGAAVLDIIAAKQAPDRFLDATMRLGRRYEEWLDLYAALDAPPKDPAADLDTHPPRRAVAEGPGATVVQDRTGGP